LAQLQGWKQAGLSNEEAPGALKVAAIAHAAGCSVPEQTSTEIRDAAALILEQVASEGPDATGDAAILHDATRVWISGEWVDYWHQREENELKHAAAALELSYSRAYLTHRLREAACELECPRIYATAHAEARHRTAARRNVEAERCQLQQQARGTARLPAAAL